MKFINYLTSISGIGIYPMISLLIFFSFFIVVIWYLFKADKNHIDHMKNIPLEEDK